MRQKGPFRRLSQALAVVLVPALVLTSVPVSAAPLPAAQAETQAIETPPPPAPEVTVNRTVPQVTPVAVIPIFSDPPTDAEIFRARLFTEAFVPLGATSPDENRELAKAILQYRTGTDPEDVSPFGTFLNAHPRSAWRPSLITNLGAHYKGTGYYTKAAETLAEGWELAKRDQTPMGKATAARALSELLDVHMQFGKLEQLEALLAEVKDRDFSGGVVQRLAQADRVIWVLRYAHDEAIASASVAVDNFMGYGQEGHKQHAEVAKFHATPDGASLADVQALTERAGLTLQMARRDGGDFIVPSIVHLKAGHFTALVKREGDRFLFADPMLGGEVWMSRAALLEEASGYSLVTAGGVPSGWKSASAAEVQNIRGKCTGAMLNHGCTSGCCSQTGPPPCNGTCRMATYTFHALLASLRIADSPVGYAPPRGPAIEFDVIHNQREAYQPAIFPFSNFGPRWNFAWLSYIEDTPSNLSASLNVHVPGGGREVASGFSVDRYLPDFDSRAVIVRTSSSPIRYERQLPDGSIEVYSQPDTGVSPRRVFLTERRDSTGNAAQVTYDAQLRVAAITDAIGQVTTLTYGLSAPLLITKVTDPFGRSATFDYNSDGRLIQITDVIDITSEFEYGSDDFIRALTTPYGTTTFAQGKVTVGYPDYYPTVWVEATDSLGGKERIENDWHTPELAASDPASTVPKGFINNVNLDRRNTFYWDKRAMALHPGDHTKAKIMHWLWSPTSAISVADALHSEKLPLENRVWYGQMGEAVGEGAGPGGRPSKVGRVLDDGTSQIYRYEYGPRGNITRETDPLGRETLYEYDTNEIDLLRVKQKNGSNWDLLESRTYNSQHQPLTVTDAAGQTTTSTYNAQGQLLTVTTPPRAGITENRTTSYGYDPNGYLQSIARPATGATTNYTYDGYGRLRTVTDSDNYTLTFDYDSLDRSTRTTYPDGSYEETVYNRLDAEKQRDRLGRWTHAFYDALRRVVATRDALGRTVSQQWCTCGSLDKLIDPNGNATTWERDVQGRVAREVRASGSAKEFTYETAASRLKKVKDAKLQEIQYQYFLDDKLQQVSYVNAQFATPSVSFTYDAHGRQATMVDGTGTTTYTYHPITAPPGLGAGRLATVDGPLANDIISYSYEELGRVVTRTVNGVTSTWTYDAVGRVSSQTEPIGTFSYAHIGTTGRLQTLTYPNSQTTTYAYYPNSGDKHLQEIHHRLSAGGSTLSKFNYTYDAVDNIKTWTQQYEANPARAYDLTYDSVDQLTAATYRTTDPTPTVLKRYVYVYDAAGNRTGEQTDDTPLSATHDNLNRLQSRQAGGAVRFVGTTNEPATVTVQGQAASTNQVNRFEGRAQVPAGTSNIAVTATDPTGNMRTNTYQVTASGTTTSYTHDANGNLTGDGTNTFEWDAENRLLRVLSGASEVGRFTYDGLGRRAEKVTGGITRNYVYDGEDIVEERLSSGGITKYFHGPGIDQPLAMQDSSGTISYYLADHLGSIVQTTSAAGTVTLTRQYDPYGNLLAGGTASGYAFTGREWDSELGLFYYRARYYAPAIGRFTTEDPLGGVATVPLPSSAVSFLMRAGIANVVGVDLGPLRMPVSGGRPYERPSVTLGIPYLSGLGASSPTSQLHLYRYVENNPINRSDPMGLWSQNQTCRLGCSILGGICVAVCPLTVILGTICVITCIIAHKQCLDACDRNCPPPPKR